MDTSSCLTSCSGLMVTGFSKLDVDRKMNDYIPDEIEAYKKYKNRFRTKTFSEIQGYEWKNKLRFVRIYFDTPTFDRITKDRAAKFVDMLSAIGGTMGLLTGFSVISAVEIGYFAIKIARNICITKMCQKINF